MNRDKTCRIIGAFLIIITILILVLNPDIKALPAFISGVFVGVGIGLLTTGENVIFYWKYKIKKE